MSSLIVTPSNGFGNQLYHINLAFLIHKVLASASLDIPIQVSFHNNTHKGINSRINSLDITTAFKQYDYSFLEQLCHTTSFLQCVTEYQPNDTDKVLMYPKHGIDSRAFELDLRSRLYKDNPLSYNIVFDGAWHDPSLAYSSGFIEFLAKYIQPMLTGFTKYTHAIHLRLYALTDTYIYDSGWN